MSDQHIPHIITATIVIPNGCEYDNRYCEFSRNFSLDLPIRKVLVWAENMGLNNPSLSEVRFSEFTGSSQ